MKITVHGLNVAIGNRPVLREVNCDIPSGASVAVVGVSGAGKTTFLRALAGLIRPARADRTHWLSKLLAANGNGVHIQGHVSVGTEPPSSLYGDRLAFLFQEACLWRNLNVIETLELVFRMRGRQPDAGRINHQLDVVGLVAARELYPHQLSVGMRARLAIARAFCIPPQLLLMDEPFAAVDPIRRVDLDRRVELLRQESGCTVVWVTHDVVEALQFATHILALTPPPGSTAEMIDIQGLAQIEDSAALPPDALAMRNSILQLITRSASPECEPEVVS
jgi:NitT/TauT family transport system ATP-binding protein